MKIENNTFHEYLNKLNTINIHKKYEKIYSRLPDKVENMENILFYGAKGIGKYSQALKVIEKYSPSLLHYEKKFIIQNQKKQEYFFKISDIHYEIDMMLLGCNARQLWHDFYNQVIDIVSTKKNKTGIILCKNIHKLDRELLPILYHYMNDSITCNVKLIYFWTSEHISFIPNHILDLFNIITYNRPKKTDYLRLLQNNKMKTSDNNTTGNSSSTTTIYSTSKNNIHLDKTSKLSQITNIKNLENNIEQMRNPEEVLCNVLINQMIDIENLNILDMRNNLYNILIYHLNIEDCIWYILKTLYTNKHIGCDSFIKINEETYKFFKYYNNNYRPIFHLEKFFIFIISVIHEL